MVAVVSSVWRLVTKRRGCRQQPVGTLQPGRLEHLSMAAFMPYSLCPRPGSWGFLPCSHLAAHKFCLTLRLIYARLFKISHQASGNLPSHQAFVWMVSVRCFVIDWKHLGDLNDWPFSPDVLCILVIFFYLPFCQYLGSKGRILNRRIQIFFLPPSTCVTFFSQSGESLVGSRSCCQGDAVRVCVCVRAGTTCCFLSFFSPLCHLT